MTPAKCRDKLVKEIVEELGIGKNEVEHILRYVSGFITDLIASGNCETVRLPYLGIFTLKPKVVTRFKNLGKGQRDPKRLDELYSTEPGDGGNWEEEGGNMQSVPTE